MLRKHQVVVKKHQVNDIYSSYHELSSLQRHVTTVFNDGIDDLSKDMQDLAEEQRKILSGYNYNMELSNHPTNDFTGRFYIPEVIEFSDSSDITISDMGQYNQDIFKENKIVQIENRRREITSDSGFPIERHFVATKKKKQKRKKKAPPVLAQPPRKTKRPPWNYDTKLGNV